MSLPLSPADPTLMSSPLPTPSAGLERPELAGDMSSPDPASGKIPTRSLATYRRRVRAGIPNCEATLEVDRPLSATAIAFFILLRYGSTFHFILRRDDMDGLAAGFFFPDDDDDVDELDAEPPPPALEDEEEADKDEDEDDDDDDDDDDPGDEPKCEMALDCGRGVTKEAGNP
jgi:hypothetical protein